MVLHPPINLCHYRPRDFIFYFHCQRDNDQCLGLLRKTVNAQNFKALGVVLSVAEFSLCKPAVRVCTVNHFHILDGTKESDLRQDKVIDCNQNVK